MDRRGVMVAAAAGLGLMPGLAHGAARRAGLRVMSFNVRLPLESDGANRWEARRDLFVATIRRSDPDIIGTQELWKIQGDYVVERLPQFSWFGIDRRGGRGDEHM
ncbi:endonuclease/exonuclease/phosphatase family protein, partial [Sphingomonas sp. CCH9-H8]